MCFWVLDKFAKVNGNVYNGQGPNRFDAAGSAPSDADTKGVFVIF